MSPIPVAGGRASTSFWAGPSRPFAGWRPDRMTLLLLSASGMCSAAASRSQPVYPEIWVGCWHRQGMPPLFCPWREPFWRHRSRSS